ncbi:MAG: 4'-phosphopantetheinyl transferase, partial [Planctomycetes bacterium]|nr:4'-phosphopantetheinyl transferase [Planctomycetota bacterium]
MNEQVPSPEAWPAADQPPELGDDELHVWSASLDIEAGLERRLEGWLSSEERDRAARFHFPRDRRRFIACRGRLRAMLSAYTGTAPHEIEFDYGPHGKPALARRIGDPSLYFNVSHSDEVAILAFRRRG